MGRKAINLEGMIFGRLKVLYRDITKAKGVYWICQCSCKDKTIVSIIAGSLLRNTETRNGTRSYGCFAKENMSRVKKKYNKYDLTGEYGIGYTFKGEEFYFDLEDYEKIKDICWGLNTEGYVCVGNVDDNNNFIKMHRLIMNAKEDEEVDHIFHNKNDNRKSKLRLVSKSKNQMNAELRKDNTSGVKGVCWHSRDEIWEVSIQVNRKRIYIGRFTDFNNAVNARKRAEDKYCGEYSYDNSMKLESKDVAQETNVNVFVQEQAKKQLILE